MNQLQNYPTAVDNAMHKLKEHDILRRIWEHDHTVWKEDSTEISNRLGWLDIAKRMLPEVERLQGFVNEVQKDGFTQALLLGMGGSSLAAEVLRNTFGVKPGFLELSVLDSTDPGAVLHFERELNPQKSLYIVSTKSGGTVETFSFMRYFYNLLAGQIGPEDAGRHFIAITDPGSQLAAVAERFHFRKVFLNDPNIGGRYSALSYFGLVPAALLGMDIEKLLRNALQAMKANGPEIAVETSTAAVLGASMGELAKLGRDKLTLVLSPSIASFSDWIEQLVAESTGKDGKGILPVVNEELLEPGFYGSDRAFVHMELEPELFQSQKISALEEAGFPVIEIKVNEPYDLGGQFFTWELATAIAGHILGIHPFNQPNVEAAKVLAREMMAAYKRDGKLPEIGMEAANNQTLCNFLSEAKSGFSYVAFQAYLRPSVELNQALQNLRTRVQTRFRVATTIGYGPRFLHSTGQLHKGVFIIITAQRSKDLVIPGQGVTFGVMQRAQAIGDLHALESKGRRLIWIDLHEPDPDLL